MIVDRQACLYEHKEKTFELSALRAAGDYEAIPTSIKSGLRRNPDLTKEYNIFYIIHASIKNHKINHQS
jgi:hypothetical protein